MINEMDRRMAEESYIKLMKKQAETREFTEKPPRQALETHIYIVRHGTSTPEVKDDRPLQERDFERELSKQGVEESKEAGKKIAKDMAAYFGDGVIVLPGGSTLPRAHKTSEYVMRQINEELGYPVSQDTLPDPSIPGIVPAKPRGLNSRYSVPGYIYAPHAVGKAELKAEGTWGRGEELPDRWMRNPSLLQKHIDEAGLGEKMSAKAIIDERIHNFTNVANMWEQIGGVYLRYWNKRKSEDPGKAKEKIESPGWINVTSEKPPHVVFIGGTHGSIIPEAWLFEIIKKYEEKTGETVSPTLEYAEFFKVYIPTDERQEATLTIHGITMPIPWELLGVVHDAAKNKDDSAKI